MTGTGCYSPQQQLLLMLTLACSVLACSSAIREERQKVIQEKVQREKEEEQIKILDEHRKKCEATNSEGDTIIGTNDDVFCEPVWDDLMCWPSTLSGTLLHLPCPEYIIGFDPKENATKLCQENGTWFSIPENPNGTWTNFSQCYHSKVHRVSVVVPMEDSELMLLWIPVLKKLSQTGYGISLATLTIAFILLSTLRKLRCPRNMLHLNLFLSFMLRALLSLLLDTLLVGGVGLEKDVTKDQNSGLLEFLPQNSSRWECKTLISVWHYCIVANYTWILMEGLYLHNLIFLALFSDSSAITVYVILGWGLPLLFVVPWVLTRLHLEDTLCWTTHEKPGIFLMLQVPVVVSVIISFALFINIVRVLMMKMQSKVQTKRQKQHYRRWAKSTLILVPLFGVHYAVFIWMSPSAGKHETLEIIWLFCDQLFASLQGFFVAMLYCLLNSEVRMELIRRWRYYRAPRRTSISGCKQRVSTNSLILSRIHQCDQLAISMSSLRLEENRPQGLPINGYRPRLSMPSCRGAIEQEPQNHSLPETHQDRGPFG